MRVILPHLSSYSNQKVCIVTEYYGAVFFEFIFMEIWYSKQPERNNPACKYVILRYGGVIEGGHFFITLRLHYVMVFQLLKYSVKMRKYFYDWLIALAIFLSFFLKQMQYFSCNTKYTRQNLDWNLSVQSKMTTLCPRFMNMCF